MSAIYGGTSPIIERDLTHKVPAYRPSYASFIDPTIEMVNTFAKAHPNRFVFTFLTCAVADVGDWNGLVPSCYVCKPIYLGNYAAADIEPIAQQIIASVLEPA